MIVRFPEANSGSRVPGLGRSTTDFLLRTCHSARRTQACQHTANLDPNLAVARVSCQVTWYQSAIQANDSRTIGTDSANF